MRESTLELLAMSRVQPFSYNHDAGEFHFGDEVVAVADIPTWGSPHQGGENLTKGDVQEYFDTVPFVFNHVHPLSLPLANIFFEHGWSDDLKAETNEVMADVLLAHTDRFDISERARLLESRNFDTMRRKHPGDVILRTIGACACLGPDYTGHLTQPEAGLMEYTFHNIDSLVQKQSLMAGLGHVARRATDWLASQGHTAHQ